MWLSVILKKVHVAHYQLYRVVHLVKIHPLDTLCRYRYIERQHPALHRVAAVDSVTQIQSVD